MSLLYHPLFSLSLPSNVTNPSQSRSSDVEEFVSVTEHRACLSARVNGFVGTREGDFCLFFVHSHFVDVFGAAESPDGSAVLLHADPSLSRGKAPRSE